MEPIQVTARFDIDGQVQPLSFTWQGRKYTVNSTGRRWQDDSGMHILVMAPIERIFELIFDPLRGRWYLKRTQFASRRV